MYVLILEAHLLANNNFAHVRNSAERSTFRLNPNCLLSSPTAWLRIIYGVAAVLPDTPPRR